MKFNMEFFKEHWYAISSVFLIIISIIVMIIFSFIKVNPPGVSRGNPVICDPNTNHYINDIQIGNTAQSGTTNSCPNNFSSAIVSDSLGNIYNSIYPSDSTITNICKLNNPTVCSLDAVITDLEVVNMGSGTTPTTPATRWIKYDEDPCQNVKGGNKDKNWYPVFQSSGIVGMSGQLCDDPNTKTVPFLCNTKNPTCGTQGLCAKKTLVKEIKDNNGTFLSDVKVMVDKCPPGWIQSELPIDTGCTNVASPNPHYPPFGPDNMVLCKKYSQSK